MPWEVKSTMDPSPPLPEYPSTAGKAFEGHSLKPLAEKDLDSSPPSPRGGHLVVVPLLPLTPCILWEQSPSLSPGVPVGGVCATAIAASCGCFHRLHRWSYFGLRLQGIFSRP